MGRGSGQETRATPGEPIAAGAPERLAIALAALGVVAALYVFRAWDDNRLTSWRWVFATADPLRLYALSAAGIAAAVLLARSPMPRRPAALLAAASAAAALPFWSAPEAIVDASRYFAEAKYLEVHGLGSFLAEWGRAVPAWTDLPLVPMLHGLAFGLLGESRAVAQGLGTLLFAGAVALTCRLGRVLWDEELGFTAGALLLAMPYLIAQVPSLLVDVPTMFFVALAVTAAEDALRRGGPARIAAAALAVALACLGKYSAWLLLTVVPVMAVVQGRAAPRALRRGLALGLSSAALILAVVLSRREVFRGQLALLLGYQAPGLRRWGESLVSTFLFQIHPFVTAAALLSLWVAARRRDLRYAVVLWPVLLLLLPGAQRSRYLIPALPMVALMAAYGLRLLRSPELRRLVAGCAVATSLVVALYGFLPFLRHTGAANLKAAGEYLDALGADPVEVLTLSRPAAEVNPAAWVPLLDLYTRRTLRYAYREPPPSARERARSSPLRFTWEYRNPDWYQSGGPGAAAVVLLADDLDRPLPPPVQDRLRGLRLARRFDADDGVFREPPLVAVYLPGPATGEAGAGR